MLDSSIGTINMGFTKHGSQEQIWERQDFMMVIFSDGLGSEYWRGGLARWSLRGGRWVG